MSTAKVIIAVVIALVVFVVIVVGVLIGAGVVGFRAAQRAGNEAATVQDLKTIAAVEIQYYNTHNRTFGTFDQIVKDQSLDQRFGGDPPIVDGYIFTLKITPRTASQPTAYTLVADPQSETTGDNHFYIDSSSSVIRFNVSRPATANDPEFGK